MGDSTKREITDAVLEQASREELIQIIHLLLEQNARLEQRVTELEARLNRNSSNSNKPPSSDTPFSKGHGRDQGQPKKVRKKRQGHRQQLLAPKAVVNVYPEPCACGCSTFTDLEQYALHQHIELPEIELLVTHFALYRGRCQHCGHVRKGYTPSTCQTGYGPRVSALLSELCGINGNSRHMAQTFLSSVLGLKISQGGIQKVLDRCSQAITPHYRAIERCTRLAPRNHIDETPWLRKGALHWLWVMVNPQSALFLIHPNRSTQAFRQLVGSWDGTLISDNYGVYQKWPRRQTCLAHLIRTARGLAEHPDPVMQRCGRWATKELQLLCSWQKHPPSLGQWHTFYARYCRLITLYHDAPGRAGRFIRALEKHEHALFTFLVQDGVSPTNNYAERSIRFAVLWRKRSFGTASDSGCRWVERILSLKQTCRLHQRSTYATLVEAFSSFFQEKQPDLSWITAP